MSEKLKNIFENRLAEASGRQLFFFMKTRVLSVSSYAMIRRLLRHH